MKSLSLVRLLATPWTAAYQAPLSMGFSRQEYWSGVPSPSPTLTAGYVKKNSVLQLLSKWSFPPAPAGNLRGLSYDLYCGNLVKLLVINLIILWSTPYDWVSLEFLTLRLVNIESASIHQLRFKFPSLALDFAQEPVGSAGGFLLCCDGLYLPICLPNLGGGGRGLPCDLIFLIVLRKSC